MSSYSSPDEDWFQYTNDFNQRAESPGGNGTFNFEAGNIDNIPFNDDDPQGEFDLAGTTDEFQYDTLRLSPPQNEQQPGTSGSNDVGGQFQSMHVMQNNDTYDQHMHQSSSVEYNSFEMPTVISNNLDAGPYQDYGIDDPNSFYASQQPSTSQGNDMIQLTDNYDMMGQQTVYLAQDQVDPSTAGNPSSHLGVNQQNDNGVPVQQPPPKAKSKKRSAPKKKPTTSAGDTVGSVLQKVANRNSQQVENDTDNQKKGELRLSLDDTFLMQELGNALNRLKQDPTADPIEIQNLENQLCQLISKNMMSQEDPNNGILDQIINRTATAGVPVQPTPPPPPPPKKAPSKKKNTKSAQQQQQQQSQPQMMPPPQAQITPAKIVMEPPTTTMVPSNSHMQNMYEGVNENYSGYHQMDEQGTSQQHYNDFQQPHSQESIHHQNQVHQQVIHTKVVPTMNQRTHNYRQSVALPSQNVNGSGPSPHLQQPLSHDSHQTEQVQEQQYHSQDHRRPQSRQVHPSVNQHHQDVQAYQSQEPEPTLGDVVRKTQGRYQGPQDAPNLRQQLISNVNASTNKQLLQRSGAPSPSPGNFQNNNIQHHQQQQPYVEPYQNHSSYPSSHDMQPSSQSQQGYENHQQYEPLDDFYDGNQSRSQEQDTILMQSEIRQYEQEEMYAPIEEPEPVVDESDMYYVELPVRTVEASKETLEEKLEEKRLVRVEKVRSLMTEQLQQLESELDLTPFRGKMDILERMLPFHHLSIGEEPVSNFDSTYDLVMSNAISHANTLGSRIRNIVLRDTMRKSTEWEENMLLFLETESERRKLEEDRQLATQDLQSFLQSSDVIHNVQNGRLNLELSKQAAPPMPDHLKDLNLKPDELSAVYKDYEFDSYDENRPRGSPFVYEELESESEFDEEQEEENEEEADEQPTRSDLSPLVGFPQPSPIPSPSRDRNESESTFDWKDEDESPLLSPETEIYKKVTDDLFGTQEDLEKSEPFPFKEISDAARKQLLQQPGIAESIGSSGESSSTSGTPPRNNNQAKPRSRSPMPSTSYARSPSPDLIEVPVPPPESRPIYRVNLYEGSPEIGEDYSVSPEPTPAKSHRRKKNVSGTSGEVQPIPLPVEVNKIKKEKEDSTQGLRLRIPVSIYQKGVKLATNEDDDVQEVPSEALKKKPAMELENEVTGRGTSRRNSRSTPSSGSESSSSQKTAKASMMMADEAITGSSRQEAPIFKTPLQTPLKTTVSDSRKRRGDKIDDSTPKNKKCKDTFETPKNGLFGSNDAPIGRFLRTMTDGRRIVMKIGKIPNNINHFVTPRRDKKGNLHKNLSPTEHTRLKMRLFKRNGEIAVEVTEHFPNSLQASVSDTPVSNEPSTSSAAVAAPIPSTAIPVKGRPAPASRKPSLEASGKEKKTSLPKNKIAYTNRFNPFANSTSSKPSTSTVTPLSRPSISIIQSSSRPPKSTTPNSSKNATSTNSSYSKPSTSLSVSKPSTSTIPPSFRKNSATTPFSSKRAPPTNSTASTGQTTSTHSGLPSSSLSMMSSQAIPGPSLIRTTPIVPKITVTNTPIAPEKISENTDIVEQANTMSSLEPWIFDTNHSSKPKSTKPEAVPALDSVNVTSTTNEHLQVNTGRSEDHAAQAQQESPRASSSLSFFDDDKTNSFPFLRSPPRTKEPLPLVEYSDDEDSDIVHSKFSHATDHLLGTNKMNKPVNGATSLVPWSDP